jgi:hypothetical protein
MYRCILPMCRDMCTFSRATQNQNRSSPQPRSSLLLPARFRSSRKFNSKPPAPHLFLSSTDRMSQSTIQSILIPRSHAMSHLQETRGERLGIIVMARNPQRNETKRRGEREHDHVVPITWRCAVVASREYACCAGESGESLGARHCAVSSGPKSPERRGSDDELSCETMTYPRLMSCEHI